MRLLLVEDDPAIAEIVTQALGEEGHVVDHAADARQGEALMHLFPYDLLILDVMLPEGPDAGYDLARRWRESGGQAPILFLTARASVDDRVEGLDVGGDDYLGKPFALRELLARVRALTRRASGQPSNHLPLPGGWTLDLAARDALHGSRAAGLTRREFSLLELLARHPGRVFSRPEIVERLWSGEHGVEEKVIDVYVSVVRRKTGENLIDTARGVGYRLGRTDV